MTAVVGKSAVTRLRKVGAAAAPVVGPAQMRFALCVARVSANAPEVVIGEPARLKMPGTVIATLVTVPVPPPPPPMPSCTWVWVTLCPFLVVVMS